MRFDDAQSGERNQLTQIEGKLFVQEKMSSGEASSSKDGMAIEGSEEAKASKGISCGMKPSQREIDEHERTHMPFRSWCKH